MKGLIDTVEDDFWNERLPFFTAQFSTYYQKSQQVHGRVHTSDERYFDTRNEIIPLTQRSGHRTYVLMHPYVFEPNFHVSIRLFDKPKHYVDQESPIGEVIRSEHTGLREVAVGSAQAWYYPTDKTIVLWECFFDSRFHIHPFATDTNMKKLWQAFERYLRQKFPQALDSGNPL